MFNLPKEVKIIIQLLKMAGKSRKKNLFLSYINILFIALCGMKDNVKKLNSKRFLGLTATQIIIVLAILVILFFFSDNSIQNRLRLESQIKDLETQIEFYKNQSEVDRAKLEELQSSDENLEKFARENYFMKKEDEEIFVID